MVAIVRRDVEEQLAACAANGEAVGVMRQTFRIGDEAALGVVDVEGDQQVAVLVGRYLEDILP